MYDIRQFKPALYILLVMGMTGFALAAESPALWLVSVGAIALNAWLVKTKRFTPMPRYVANAVTMLALLFVISQVLNSRDTPIMIIGQFLVLLQLVKLFEQRANRDFAQLLVLSLLLMVAAAISTSSLLFGLLFIAYLFLSLYCCLLFHLKVETDEAKRAMQISDDRVNPSTLRQDQRYLPRSMRRLTWLVSSVALAMAVAVFILFPRGAGAGMLGQFHRPSQTLTGFSDEMGFQQVARITQNQEVVAYLNVRKNGEPVRNGTIYLRGKVHDTYNANPANWSRTQQGGERTEVISRGETWRLANRDLLDRAPPGDRWELEFMLRPTGTHVLFAMPGPLEISIDRRARLRFSPADEVIESVEALHANVSYTVICSGSPGESGLPANFVGFRRIERPEIHPRIREYALRPEVSGASTSGAASLAAERGNEEAPHPLDETIARNIENHLQKTFTYTLDLTDARRIIEGQDPMVAFLYDLKRGHCEYFAGAMTLMCQSLGMQARVVTGFRIDGSAYNEFSDNFVVRQSHAHAWVEVLTPEGWRMFDPTSGREAGTSGDGQAGLWGSLRKFVDFLEYAWANNIVAYDQDSRESLISEIEKRSTNWAIRGSGAFGDLRSLLDIVPKRILSSVLGFIIALMVVALFASIGYFLYERWRLRRRAARIGIASLSTSDQLRLARQLGFYDELMRLLERHGITRPKHMTPQEFGESLSFLPAEVYDAVLRLTSIFYRIRFGGAELSATQLRRLGRVISRLAEQLEPTPRID